MKTHAFLRRTLLAVISCGLALSHVQLQATTHKQPALQSYKGNTDYWNTLDRAFKQTIRTLNTVNSLNDLATIKLPQPDASHQAYLSNNLWNVVGARSICKVHMATLANAIDTRCTKVVTAFNKQAQPLTANQKEAVAAFKGKLIAFAKYFLVFNDNNGSIAPVLTTLTQSHTCYEDAALSCAFFEQMMIRIDNCEKEIIRINASKQAAILAAEKAAADQKAAALKQATTDKAAADLKKAADEKEAADKKIAEEKAKSATLANQTTTSTPPSMLKQAFEAGKNFVANHPIATAAVLGAGLGLATAPTHKPVTNDATVDTTPKVAIADASAKTAALPTTDDKAHANVAIVATAEEKQEKVSSNTDHAAITPVVTIQDNVSQAAVPATKPVEGSTVAQTINHPEFTDVQQTRDYIVRTLPLLPCLRIADNNNTAQTNNTTNAIASTSCMTSTSAASTSTMQIASGISEADQKAIVALEKEAQTIYTSNDTSVNASTQLLDRLVAIAKIYGTYTFTSKQAAHMLGITEMAIDHVCMKYATQLTQTQKNTLKAIYPVDNRWFASRRAATLPTQVAAITDPEHLFEIWSCFHVVTNETQANLIQARINALDLLTTKMKTPAQAEKETLATYPSDFASYNTMARQIIWNKLMIKAQNIITQRDKTRECEARDQVNKALDNNTIGEYTLTFKHQHEQLREQAAE